MPEVKINPSQLTSQDRRKLRVLKAKVCLAEAGVKVRHYQKVQDEVLQYFPELNTEENIRFFRFVWYCQSTNEDITQKLEEFANLKTIENESNVSATNGAVPDTAGNK